MEETKLWKNRIQTLFLLLLCCVPLASWRNELCNMISNITLWQSNFFHSIGEDPMDLLDVDCRCHFFRAQFFTLCFVYLDNNQKSAGTWWKWKNEWGIKAKLKISNMICISRLRKRFHQISNRRMFLDSIVNIKLLDKRKSLIANLKSRKISYKSVISKSKRLKNQLQTFEFASKVFIHSLTRSTRKVHSKIIIWTIQTVNRKWWKLNETFQWETSSLGVENPRQRNEAIFHCSTRFCCYVQKSFLLSLVDIRRVLYAGSTMNSNLLHFRKLNRRRIWINSMSRIHSTPPDSSTTTTIIWIGRKWMSYIFTVAVLRVLRFEGTKSRAISLNRHYCDSEDSVEDSKKKQKNKLPSIWLNLSIFLFLLSHANAFFTIESSVKHSQLNFEARSRLGRETFV